ncbi:TraR/DksA family transcriptional regulator [Marinobacterium arenosum]|uniref:TraR/DksA family transcriptional regulator n=1 Tax=Marinobacterium arenosum TaxID=2862496 RepID=UPI001C96DC48|nr:TraR/DksA family transcriptional regulator [Marinobacterium arenosum]MBY4675296.1 TraR/DksA family transcriptional regulator [Marinobacterium arenosum]
MSGSLTASQVLEFKGEIRALLEQLRQEVLQELADAGHERSLELIDGPGDQADEAVAETVAQLNIAHLARHVEEIRSCRHALYLIETGDFGFCENCGEDIELNRLRANPVATLCVSCQARKERS